MTKDVVFGEGEGKGTEGDLCMPIPGRGGKGGGASLDGGGTE